MSSETTGTSIPPYLTCLQEEIARLKAELQARQQAGTGPETLQGETEVSRHARVDCVCVGGGGACAAQQHGNR